MISVDAVADAAVDAQAAVSEEALEAKVDAEAAALVASFLPPNTLPTGPMMQAQPPARLTRMFPKVMSR